MESFSVVKMKDDSCLDDECGDRGGDKGIQHLGSIEEVKLAKLGSDFDLRCSEKERREGNLKDDSWCKKEK